MKKYFYPGVIKEDGDKAHLIAGKCKKCGAVEFPKANMCCHCLGEEFEEIELNDTGTLVSYTTTYMPVQKFNPPHSVGYVQLSDDIRIFTPIIFDKDHPFRVGQKMQLEICEFWKDDEGDPIEGYKFRPTD